MLSTWLARGFWAILDQGLFSVSNFALNLLLARWLAPHSYGAFATGFAVFLLISTIHTGFITTPMLVFGAGRYGDRLSEYLSTLVYGGHSIFAGLISFLLLLVSFIFALAHASDVSTVFLALVLSQPFILLLWLMRGVCYLCFLPSLAALGSALYMALMLAGVYSLYQLGWLSAASGLGVMGLSSLAVGFFLAMRLHIRPPPFRSFRNGELAREIMEKHWRFGLWNAPTGALGEASLSVYYILLPILVGFEASGALRALYTLILPAQLAYVALTNLLQPTFTRARGTTKLNTLIVFTLALFVSGSVLYWLLLGVFHDSLIALLYGGRYLEVADLLWLIGLLPIGFAVAIVTGAVFRTLERLDIEFRANMLSAVLALTLGTLMMFAWGIVGAVVGLLASRMIPAGMMMYVLVTLRRDAGGGVDLK